MKGKYSVLGRLIKNAREQQNMEQATLAASLGIKQQAISRWENGGSRPKEVMLNDVISILRVNDIAEWSKASKYNNLTPCTQKDFSEDSATLTNRLPLGCLPDKDFERFSVALLSFKYPEATVYLYGDKGDKQDGIDIKADFENGKCHTYQCKREKQYGPGKAKEAIKKHKIESDKKIILLSRSATSETRKEINKHKNWEIWDVEDITRIVKLELTLEQARRLIKIYFPGRVKALLGIDPTSPWETDKEFFEPYLSESKIFNHAWDLVGRENEINQIIESMKDDTNQITLIAGPAGTGKSRILRTFCQRFANVNKPTQLRIASAFDEITRESIDDLGSGKKVLIIDDAHDKNLKEIELLMSLAGSEKHSIKLVILTRPYFINSLQSSIRKVGISSTNTVQINLQPLSKENATMLAKQILTTLGGNPSLAPRIAEITHESPLATALGSYIVAKSKIHPNTLASNKEFKDYIIDKFEEIVTGEIASGIDCSHIKELLKIISLVQPFNLNDNDFVALSNSLLGLLKHDTIRLVNLLCDAGVLIKVRNNYKIAPDALADLIAENACLTNGIITGYSNLLFDQIKSISSIQLLKRFLFNIGKVDWRVSHADKLTKSITNPIWDELCSLDKQPFHIHSIASATLDAAVYQPKNALKLADALILQNENLHEVAELLKYIAYNPEYILEACERLWLISRSDTSHLNNNQNHPINVLRNICEYKPEKLVEYTETVVDYTIELLSDDSSWEQANNPLLILEPALSTVAEKTVFNGNTVTMSHYPIKIEAVKEIRQKIINVLLELIMHKNTAIAIKAAKSLSNALRYPNHYNDDALIEKWRNEFSQTLDQIYDAITKFSQNIDDITLVEIQGVVDWSAAVDINPARDSARKIISSLPATLEFRCTQALMDGWGRMWRMTSKINNDTTEWDTVVINLAEELSTKYDQRELLDFLKNKLEKLNKLNIPTSASLIQKITMNSEQFAELIINESLSHPDSELATFAGIALLKVTTTDRKTGVVLSKKLIESNHTQLIYSAASGYDWHNLSNEQYSVEEIQVIQLLCKMWSPAIAFPVNSCLARIASQNFEQAIEMFNNIEFSDTPKSADRALEIFYHHATLPIKELTSCQISPILDKLSRVSSLNEHWIKNFLSHCSNKHPTEVISFFMRRVELSESRDDYKFEPLPAHYIPQPELLISKTNQASYIMKQLKIWISVKPNSMMRARLFAISFKPNDPATIEFLSSWILSANNATELNCIVNIVSHESYSFFLQNNIFVKSTLSKAETMGPRALRQIEKSLFRCCIPTSKSGTPGGAFKEDIELRDKSNELLNDKSLAPVLLNFYAKLNDHAKGCIEEAINDYNSTSDFD